MPPQKSVSDRQLQLLALVVDEELNGREVAAAFQNLVGEPIPYGTLYKVMDDMANLGLVSSREERNGRRTRHFRISAAGKKALKAGREYRAWLSTFGIEKKKPRRSGGNEGPRGKGPRAHASGHRQRGPGRARSGNESEAEQRTLPQHEPRRDAGAPTLRQSRDS